jgi:beta-glucosidase-like glycosyl hydrolase/CubicO group peptidase (beta-lactamase class C family)
MPSAIHSQKGRPQSARAASLPAEAEAWVRETLARMTLDEKIGQLVIVNCYGGFTPIGGEEFQRLARQVEQNHVGGLIIANRAGLLGIERSQVYPTAALVNALQQRARIPLLVGADFERGTAMRLQEGTSFPQAMAVAATGRAEDAYTMGKVTALEGRAAGVPWIFAPVCDVNSNPANPIINTRSFGEDPERVGKLAASFIRGVQENGGLATAKHFPGHGDTSVDSHLDLPVVCGDREHLEQIEFPPFRAAIAAGVGSIMTAHLAVPALDPDANLPATFSEKITTDLLRHEMGFDGLVVTDDLNMGGVTARYSPGEIAVRSILAGSDLLLAPPNPDVALAALREAAASGRLPVARIDEAVRRILRAKAKLGLHKSNTVSLESLAENFGTPEFARAAQDIADRGVTLLRDTAKILPLDATQPMRAFLVAVAGDPDRAPAEIFEREIRGRVDSLETVRCDTRYNTADKLSLPAADNYDVLIIALLVRVADRKGSVGLPPEQVLAVRQLLATEKPVVVACFGSPYLVFQFPKSKTWLSVFSNVEVAQRTAGRALFGEVAIGGKIPVTVPDVVAAGSGIDVPANPMTLVASPNMNAKLAPAYALLDQAVADGAFPGGVLAVGHDGQLAIHAFGRLSADADAPAVTPETIYDTASLTKPIVTATLAAMLAEPGQLDVSAPVARYLPEWTALPDAERRAVTVRHLLTHTSGLPAHREYFKSARTRQEVVAQALAEPLEADPGTRSVYSDIGFILLGEVLERLLGRPLDQAAMERIFAPLAMTATMFTPPPVLQTRIAPTENDTELRKRPVRGEVHDENAWVMGGVAGHAGLFSTAGDLAIFCQMMLNGGQYAHRRLLQRVTIKQFTTVDSLSAGMRTPGWMARTVGSSSGRYFSSRSFGHLGFTGTSMWVDPDKHLFVVLLTNRVNPTRQNDKMQRVRPALHNSIVENLGLTPPPERAGP